MWNTIDQGEKTKAFVDALLIGKIHHAYLILGPQNSGKDTFAITMAQAVNCIGINPPCRICVPCNQIRTGTHPDVDLIDSRLFNEGSANSKILKDVAREIRGKASLRPYEGKYRVFVIYEAKKMTVHTSNALLKMLEEPEPNVLYILVATSEQDLLPTVASRCQKIRLNKLNVVDTIKMLTEETGINLSDATEMAKLAQGGIEWAGQNENDSKNLARIREKLVNISLVIGEDIKGHLKYADQLVSKWNENDQEVKDELQLWLYWWRDLMMIKIGMPSLVVCSSQINKLYKNIDTYDMGRIYSSITAIQETLDCLDHNVNPKLAIPYMVLTIGSKNS